MGGGAQVVGISCDSRQTLTAWAEHLGGVRFPLCSDYWPHGSVAMRYGVFNDQLGRPERAILVVDPAGIIRYIDVHTLREVPDEAEIAEELERID